MVRRLALLAAALLLLAAGVVLPGGERVVTVSRLGGAVTLLPAGPAFSWLPLARRVRVPAAAGAATVAVPVQLAMAGGATMPATVHLALRGAGRLPVDAGTVRARGWDAAWAAWLQPRLALGEAEVTAVLEASGPWREAIPGGEARPVDVAGRLGAPGPGVELVTARLEARPEAELVRAVARQRLAARSRRPGRLVVIGLDALDWRLVDDLVARGAMPNLARLLGRGQQVVLHVPPPLLSPLIWTTIATGVPPEVHGVLDFVEPDPQGGAPRPISSAARKATALWEMAAAAGRTSAVIGWWATFPAAAPAGGAVYSDRLSEQLMGLAADAAGVADPPEAAAVARRLAVSAVEVTPALLAPILPVSAAELAAIPPDAAAWDDPLGGLVRLMAATLTVERLTEHELARGTEVVLAYLEGTDTVGHLFAAFRPPALPAADPARARRFAAVVDRYHAHVDAFLGRVAAALGAGDTLVLVSDHGFTWFDDRPTVPSGAHTPTAVHWHRREGMLLAVGPGVQRSGRRERLDLADVTPLLLALANLPPGADLPGHTPAWVRTATAEPVRWAALAPVQRAAAVELPPEARAEELAKLRALGYLAGGDEKPAATAAPVADGARRDIMEARRLHNLALRLIDSGDMGGAEDALRQAIALHPGYAPSRFGYAMLLRTAGRWEEAERELWAAVDAGLGDPPAALVRVAADYRKRGQAGRAVAVLEEGRRRYPDSAQLWLGSGTLLGELGEYAAARTCLERAAVLSPQDPLVFRNLGAARLALGDRAGARAAFAEALRLDPGNAELRRQLEKL